MTSLLLWNSLLMDNTASKSKQKLQSQPIPKICEDVNKCRICAEDDGEIPIINNVIHPNLVKEIYNFSGLKVELSDGCSKHMCQNCLDLLNGCIMFREMCRKTNKMIIEMSIMKDKCTKWNDIDQQSECESSYSLPSPNYDEGPQSNISNREFLRNLAIKSSRYKLKKSQCKGERAELGLCDVCGKTVRASSLPLHKFTHKNIFPYKCEKCPYKGRTPDLLRTHKLSHLSKDQLPFKCTQCPTAMTSASNLSKHMLHHRRPKTKTQKHFKCSHCDSAFTYKFDMTRHIKQKHVNAKQKTINECEICSIQFSSRNLLLDHQIKVHKVKKFKGRLPAYIQAQIE